MSMAKQVRKVLTLVFVIDSTCKNPRVLLGLKKRGFGAGKWNGFGGKVEAKDRTIAAAAQRELEEEANIRAPMARQLGVICFEFLNVSEMMEVHVFRANSYKGEIKESDEMRPEWFDLGDIPFDSMWLDDAIWFKHMLEEELFVGYFLFRGHSEIIKHHVEVVSDDKFGQDEAAHRQCLDTLLLRHNTFDTESVISD